ncbi:MAG: DUF1634 domain-containing protein [Sporolactobacillus sp.]
MSDDQTKMMSDEELKKAQKMDQIERIIGHVLRIGVGLSAFVIVAGIIAGLFAGETGYRGTTFPKTPSAILSGLILLKPLAILMTGLFLLILTPVLRVAVSIYAFAVEKDYLYVWITTIVLFILVIAMWIGYMGH